MRVMQIMAGKAQGGAETFFTDLVIGLHQKGLQQCVVIRENAAVESRLRDAGIVPVTLPFRKIFDWRTKKSIQKEIEKFKPDLVQSFMNRAISFTPSPENCVHKFHLIGWFGGYYKVANYRHCQTLVGVTEGLRQHQIENGWPAEHAFYLPTFVPTEIAAPLPRAEFDTPDDAPLFLALGRLHWKKGFDVLLKALADVPAAHLWLAGSGPLEADLKKLCHDLHLEDRVRFLGWCNDRAALYQTADYCVFPSRYEPFGTITIEAWAYQTPLIVTAAQGPKATVHDGEDAVLLPIDDVAALRKAMQDFVDHPEKAKALAAKGHARYQQDYTEDAVTNRYLEFYKNLLLKKAA